MNVAFLPDERAGLEAIDRQLVFLQEQVKEFRKQKRKLYLRAYMRKYMGDRRSAEKAADDGARKDHRKRDRSEYMKSYRSTPEYRLKRKLSRAGIDKAAIASEVARLRRAIGSGVDAGSDWDSPRWERAKAAGAVLA